MIRNLGKKHTVILSSHILSEISAVCDDVLILSHGKLVASDTTDNLGKLMEDKVTLHLTIKGDEETIKGALDSVEGVENIEYKESDEKDCVDVMTHHDRSVYTASAVNPMSHNQWHWSADLPHQNLLSGCCKWNN